MEWNWSLMLVIETEASNMNAFGAVIIFGLFAHYLEVVVWMNTNVHKR